MGARSPLLKAFGDDFSWSLLDVSPDATVIVSSTGELVFVNEHAGDLFGYEVDDLLGRAVEDLLPEGVRAVHRAHRTRYRAEPTVRSMGAGLELWARRSDGSEVPVEISLSPVRLGDEVFAIVSARDTAVRVEAEDQLHRVLHTLDSTDDGVFIFDAATMRFQFVNDGAVRLVGYERAELLTMSLLHLNPYTSELEYRRLIRSLLDERPLRSCANRSGRTGTDARCPSRRRSDRHRPAVMAPTSSSRWRGTSPRAGEPRKRSCARARPPCRRPNRSRSSPRSGSASRWGSTTP